MKDEDYPDKQGNGILIDSNCILTVARNVQLTK